MFDLVDDLDAKELGMKKALIIILWLESGYTLAFFFFSFLYHHV